MLNDILATPPLRSEIALMSRTEPKLRAMESFGRRLVSDNGLAANVWATLDRREAIGMPISSSSWSRSAASTLSNRL